MKRILFLLYIGFGVVAGGHAQTDVTTRYVKNASMESGFKNWTNEGLQLQSNTDFAYKAGTLYAEKWVSSSNWVGDASLSQTLKNLPAGKYQLKVGAQNLSQSSPATQCAGAYIYADEQKTSVYTPGEYAVDFSTLTGTVQIGFKASGARGNWLAVDNFRLYQVAEIDNQELVDSLARQIVRSDALAQEEMDAAVLAALTTVTNEARSLSAESEQATLQSALVALNTAVEKALFAVRLSQATPGTGTAPKVTATNHYVITGATQALMRATMTGSNILERGVCWSTEHNPTVLDNRTTDYYTCSGSLYHLTGLTPATVYYLRPYVMNKTYTVAYGDEVKIVTHPKGNCSWSWNEGAPTVAANVRCRLAVEETIDYFNEWTGIRGFTLTGNYGADTPTADCSYGGWMHIGPNAAYQAIGTVLHETGHGVGVGTSSRWWDTDFHNDRWFGREANRIYQFLENQEGNANYYMKGDRTHAWGNGAQYDWFVNGADKDKHVAIQYIGGCALLYGFFVDGRCPTSGHPNGVSGYTYNMEDTTTYYLMCKDADRGLNTGLMTITKVLGTNKLGVSYCLNAEDTIPAEAAWKLEFDAQAGKYLLRNAAKGTYVSHSGTSFTFKTKASETEQFQLMPDRTDVTLTNNGASIQTHGYWLTWYADGNKALSANPKSATGTCTVENFSTSNSATKQQWIILTAEEVTKLKPAHVTGIEQLHVETEGVGATPTYNLQGQPVAPATKGLKVQQGKVIYEK